MLSQTAPIDLHVPLFGTNVYANLFLLIVGPSTTGRKSTAVRIGTNMLRTAIQRKNPKTGIPSTRDFMTPTPGSAEVLVDGFSDMPQQLLSYEEFGSFLQASQGDGSNNSFAKIRTTMTEVYDGSSVGRNTVKNKKKNVTNPRLSIIGAVATDYLESYSTETDWTAGFLARFMTFCASPEFYSGGHARHMELADDDLATRSWLVDLFLFMRNRMGKYSPCVGMDADAKEIWRAWEHERSERATAANRIVQAGFHRADAFTLKLALLMGLDFGRPYEGEAEWKIGAEEMIPAVKIASLHLSGLESLGETISFNSKDMQDRRNVLSAIKLADPELGLTRGELAGKTHLLVSARLDTIINTLMEQKEILKRNVSGAPRYFKA